MPENELEAPLILVIGAGPAGLAAAWELASRGYASLPGPGAASAPDIRDGVADLPPAPDAPRQRVRVLVVDKHRAPGGLARTIVHNGNRIDIGGHRYHSRYPEIVDWWTSVLPLQGRPSKDDLAYGRDVPLSDDEEAPDPAKTDHVMLSRGRLSRILFLGRFFDYPVALSVRLLRDLGIGRSLRIFGSFLAARIRPVRPERTIEDYLVNNFGRELYGLFFRDYTAKHWGVPPDEIPRDWGEQRFGGLSVWTAVRHFASSLVGGADRVYRDASESGLVDRFLYPKTGSGHMWETMCDRIIVCGGDVRLRTETVALNVGLGEEGPRVTSVTLRDRDTGETSLVQPDAVVSTMPLKDLLSRIEGVTPPPEIRHIAEQLPYRDYVLVCLLLERLALTNLDGSPLRDDYLYVQDRSVGFGRLQLYKNWSPYLVADDSLDWVGFEYTCDEGDRTWEASDATMVERTLREACSLGMVGADEAPLDSKVLRVRKAYPGYWGAYERFGEVRGYLDGIANLVPAGRNGTHRYNDIDRSMLTGIAAARCILGGAPKEAVWLIANGTDYVG